MSRSNLSPIGRRLVEIVVGQVHKQAVGFTTFPAEMIEHDLFQTADEAARQPGVKAGDMVYAIVPVKCIRARTEEDCPHRKEPAMSEMEYARQIAAQCWCDPETEQIELDTRLAEAFAKRFADQAAHIERLEAVAEAARELRLEAERCAVTGQTLDRLDDALAALKEKRDG